MNLGYSVVGNGWDFGAARDDDGMTIAVPVARNPDGSSITGPSYEYITFDDAKSARYSLTYPAATLDKSKATLTVRARLDDQPTTVPASGWEYADERTIRLLPAGTPFKQSHVYELRYTAKDPVVAAVGLAATRDFISFLRHAAKDGSGTPNPLAGDVRYVYTFSISQPTRALNDFVALGFNEDERRRTRHRRHAQVDRRRQRQSDQLSFRADRQNRAQSPESPVSRRRVSLRLSGAHRSSERPDRRAQRPLRGEQHLPQGVRRQLVERVLGEGGLAAAHRHPRERFAAIRTTSASS